MKNFILTYVCFLIITNSFGQTIIPFRDTVFCTPQIITILKPDIVDSIELFEWKINNKIADKVENIEVDSKTNIAYNLITRKGSNFITNGDFENGDIDFSTEYILNPTYCTGGFNFCEGAYAVTTNPQYVHSLMYPCQDRKNNQGKMLLVNAAPKKQNIWCQDVNLIENKDYVFSCWGTLSFPDDASPEVKINIDNGAFVQNFKFKNDPCVWQEFKVYFNPKNKSNVKFCISNESTKLGGNDYLIDDISLFILDTKKDTIALDYQPILLSIDGPDNINCKDKEPKILEAITNQNEIEYSWETSNGKILGETDSKSITIGSSGNYKVTVTNSIRNCQISSEKNISTSFDGTTNLYYPNIVSLNAQNQENKSFKVTIDNECSENQNLSLNIYDRWGNLVFQKKDSSDLIWNLVIGTKSTEIGTYTFFVTNNSLSSENILLRGSFTVVN